MEPLLVTKPEAAETLAVSVRQLELYIRTGEIVVRRLGRRCVRIERTELARFVKKLADGGRG